MLRPLKYPRNHSATKVESESKTKHFSLESKNQDVAANSDDDSEQSKTKKRRFAASLPEEVEAFKKSLEVKNTNKSTMWAVRAF